MQNTAKIPPTRFPKTLVVAPNSRARALGNKSELRVGWKHNDNGLVFWWGSAKNPTALKQLIADLKTKYGKFAIEKRDSDGEYCSGV